jgi:RNA polymerase sigma-70 factor (ECF subfamily)
MGDERETRWRTWMVAAQAGETPAYEKLIAELIPYLRRFVQRRLLNAAAAEDVVQNVLISIHRARGTYRPERRFSPWLNASARNAIIDQVRQQTRRSRREVSLEADGVAEPASEPVEPLRQRLSPELEAALSVLPDAQRQAVELIHLHGCSVAEAAAQAGTTKAALKVRAHRGYRAMRAHIETLRLEEDGE